MTMKRAWIALLHGIIQPLGMVAVLPLLMVGLILLIVLCAIANVCIALTSDLGG